MFCYKQLNKFRKARKLLEELYSKVLYIPPHRCALDKYRLDYANEILQQLRNLGFSIEFINQLFYKYYNPYEVIINNKNIKIRFPFDLSRDASIENLGAIITKTISRQRSRKKAEISKSYSMKIYEACDISCDVSRIITTLYLLILKMRKRQYDDHKIPDKKHLYGIDSFIYTLRRHLSERYGIELYVLVEDEISEESVRDTAYAASRYEKALILYVDINMPTILRSPLLSFACGELKVDDAVYIVNALTKKCNYIAPFYSLYKLQQILG